MHTFNLRFGRPTTPEQTAAYEQLYPLLAAHRDRVMKDSGLAAKADDKAPTAGVGHAPPPPQPSDFFRGMRSTTSKARTATRPGRSSKWPSGGRRTWGRSNT